MSVISRTQTRPAAAALAAACLAVIAPAAAQAQTTLTFGADINARVADNPGYSCANPGPDWAATWGSVGRAFTTGPCDVLGGIDPSQNFAVGSETFVVPVPEPNSFIGETQRTGTITEVRIKTGAMPNGPAQARVTVYSATRQGMFTACCIGKEQSAPFTLTPNSVVRVPVSLKVAHIKPVLAVTYDSLALTMLDNRAPFPAQMTPGPTFLSRVYAPPVAVGEERFTGGQTEALVPLMQADVVVDPVGSNGGGGSAGVLGMPTFSKVTSRPGRVLADIACSATGACGGTARLIARRTRATEHAAKTVTLGSAAYAITAGSTKRITVRLSKAGRNYVKARSSRVRATLQLRDSTGKVIKSTAVVVRA